MRRALPTRRAVTVAVAGSLLLALGCGRAPTAAPAAQGGAGYKNVLRWQTVWEKDNAGFDVYRGESKDGPFERITRQPVPGAGVTREQQSYVYEDTTIDPAKEYFYFVESLKTNGERVRLTGAFRVKAKAPRAP